MPSIQVTKSVTKLLLGNWKICIRHLNQLTAEANNTQQLHLLYEQCKGVMSVETSQTCQEYKHLPQKARSIAQKRLHWIKITLYLYLASPANQYDKSELLRWNSEGSLFDWCLHRVHKHCINLLESHAGQFMRLERRQQRFLLSFFYC